MNAWITKLMEEGKKEWMNVRINKLINGRRKEGMNECMN